MSATEQVDSNILTTNTHHGLHTKYMRGTLRNPGLDRYPRLVRSICLVSFGFTFQYLGYTYTQILGLADLMTSSSSPSSLACHWFSSSESALLDSSLLLDLASDESLATSSPS